MAFKDLSGQTDIPMKLESMHFSICYDDDTGEYNPPSAPGTLAYILWVPNKDDIAHEHIELSDKACLKLYKWLGKYLKAKGLL